MQLVQKLTIVLFAVLIRGLRFYKLLSLCHHHHLPPWIMSRDLFRHRRVAIVSLGVHDLFFLEVCSWGRVSGVWCCPFFQDGWSSFVCVWISRLVLQRSLVLFLWLRFLCTFLMYQYFCLSKFSISARKCRPVACSFFQCSLKKKVIDFTPRNEVRGCV